MITHVIRCGEFVLRSTNHGKATHVIWVPVDEIISATRRAASLRSRSSLMVPQLRRKLTTTVRVPRRSARPRYSSSSVSNRSPSSSSSFVVSSSVADDVCTARRHDAGTRARGAARPARVLLARDELVAQHRRLEAVRGKLDARRRRAPGPLAARAADAFVDEAPLRERAQVVAARRFRCHFSAIAAN